MINKSDRLGDHPDERRRAVALLSGLAVQGRITPREYTAAGRYIELYFSVSQLPPCAAFVDARRAVVERRGEQSAAIVDDAAIFNKLPNTDGNLQVLRGALDVLWHYFDEINQNQRVDFIDRLIADFRALFIERGWNDPEDRPLVESLVWIHLALFTFSLTNIADQHAKVGQHAREGAAAIRQEYAARTLLPEDQGRHYQPLEHLCDEIMRQDRRAVAAEKSAISAEFIAIGLVHRLEQAGIPRQFLRPTGPHRPRDVGLSLLIAEAAVQFEKYRGRRAPLPTLDQHTNNYHGEFFDFIVEVLPTATADLGVKCPSGNNAIAGRIKRVLPVLRQLRPNPLF